MVNQKERTRKIGALLVLLVKHFSFIEYRTAPVGVKSVICKKASLSYDVIKVLIANGYMYRTGTGKGTKYKLDDKIKRYSHRDLEKLADTYYQHGQRNPKKGKALEKTHENPAVGVEAEYLSDLDKADLLGEIFPEHRVWALTAFVRTANKVCVHTPVAACDRPKGVERFPESDFDRIMLLNYAFPGFSTKRLVELIRDIDEISNEK